MIRYADRMRRLGTETAFLVLAKAKALEAQGRSIIHLEIGEPDFDTPGNIKAAATRALDEGYTHYGPAAGLPQLREAIAEETSASRGIKVDASNVVVTPGGKPVMFFALLALINDGDEVIYPNPGFPIYESVINFIGAKAMPIVLREEMGFRFDIDELKRLITPRTRMIVLNSPQNPTGGVLTDEDLREIAWLAVEHDLIVLSDEIYRRIIYDGFQHKSIASLPGMLERTIILDGYSKTFAMTGWRLGYGIMPAELAERMAQLQINSNSCTASFTQIAGIEALRGPQKDVEAMVAEFRRRRDVIVDGLNNIPGFRCHRPQGAFYVFPNITGTGRSSRALEDYLLNEAGIAALSGTAFGKHGDGYLRFSYANSVPNIEEALRRIRSAVEKL
ncbi:MAG: aspartate aminotransferase [Ignavibacteriales bacterium CG07_land_8_20_14_0_80_59_12]|nr:MAG: aspartate aminotransferase [Ignavibacteriales bacterium CG07_land_8_20_14_0_80_59_12]